MGHDLASPHAPAASAGLFQRCALARLPSRLPPQLAVIVDTEEEFDWNAPFRRDATAVTAMRAQLRAQRVLERFGLIPTYAITYPVATQPEGYGPLLELEQSGACEIGAHLHPWVTPPFAETVSARNSLAGNLSQALEQAKLHVLSETIAARFGRRPLLYKAGRYGLGPHTEGALEALGFAIDASMLPGIDLRAQHGPDFRQVDARPRWFGRSRPLLELPPTAGFVGLLAGTRLCARMPATGPGVRLLRSLMARGRLVERITLTPEGVDHLAHRRLLRALIDQGQRIFTLSYHSPSLVPGHTPYVATRSDLERFLATLERTLDFFMAELGGQPTTPTAILALARRTLPVSSRPLAPDHDAQGLGQDREVEHEAPVL